MKKVNDFGLDDNYYLFEMSFNNLDDEDLAEHYKKEVSDIKHNILGLKEQISEMLTFFDCLAEPIMKKAVRHVVWQLRRYSDDRGYWQRYTNLNFLENFCVVQHEDPMDYNPVVDDVIISCSKWAYKKLSYDEQFIIDHQTPKYNKHGGGIITNAFYEYAPFYVNNKIRDALDS